MQESLWYKKIEKTIIEENEKLYKNDFKFYQVDSFLKIAKKIDSFAPDCKTCKEAKINSEDLAENLFEYLKGDVHSRRNYEKKTGYNEYAFTKKTSYLSKTVFYFFVFFIWRNRRIVIWCLYFLYHNPRIYETKFIVWICCRTIYWQDFGEDKR